MLEVKLIKEMGYERIDCVCGMAVVSKDPSPEFTREVKQIAIEEGAKFSLIDASFCPDIKYKAKLPCVMIGKNIYHAEASIIRSVVRKEKHDG